jgi:hypothetical protein
MLRRNTLPPSSEWNWEQSRRLLSQCLPSTYKTTRRQNPPRPPKIIFVVNSVRTSSYTKKIFDWIQILFLDSVWSLPDNESDQWQVLFYSYEQKAGACGQYSSPTQKILIVQQQEWEKRVRQWPATFSKHMQRADNADWAVQFTGAWIVWGAFRSPKESEYRIFLLSLSRAS